MSTRYIVTGEMLRHYPDECMYMPYSYAPDGPCVSYAHTNGSETLIEKSGLVSGEEYDKMVKNNEKKETGARYALMELEGFGSMLQARGPHALGHFFDEKIDELQSNITEIAKFLCSLGNRSQMTSEGKKNLISYQNILKHNFAEIMQTFKVANILQVELPTFRETQMLQFGKKIETQLSKKFISVELNEWYQGNKLLREPNGM